jgi:hypothetical protein
MTRTAFWNTGFFTRTGHKDNGVPVHCFRSFILEFEVVLLDMSQSEGKNWEGLGGPVYFDALNNGASLDPTLDSCCQRDLEDRRRGQALRSTLQRFDVVAERERRRRHAVSFNGSANCEEQDSGCRCIYDPNSDGGEYRTLTELRAARESTSQNDAIHEPEYDVDDRKNSNENDHSAIHNDRSDEESEDEYDYLLDEDIPNGDTALSVKNFEEARRAELEWELLKNEIALLHGYGIHRQIHPRRVLTMAGLNASTNRSHIVPPSAVVLHLVDADSMASASLDLYLDQLAKRYRGTMFLRSSGRATLLLDAVLVAKSLPMFRSLSQPDVYLPALVAIRDGVAVNACLQLQGLLRSRTITDFEIEEAAVHDWLDGCGVLRDHPPNVDAMCRLRPEEEALLDSCLRSVTVSEEERYDCGREGCFKTFPHEHVGEQNERQDGLLLSEAEILGKQ